MGLPQFTRHAAFAAGLWLLLPGNMLQAGEFAVEKTELGVRVLIDGQLFCEYQAKSGRQPAIWPIMDSTGVPMTRSYPLGPPGEHEKKDHPHHRSLWFSHGIVNGHDFWAAHGAEEGEPQNEIVHQKFAAAEVRNGRAYIETQNDWITAEGEKVCSDERKIWMGTKGAVRWIDYTTRLIASVGDVTFGDTKEGTFAVRVAGTMKVDAEQGGQIVSSTGRRGQDAWGQPADWVDYYGPVEGKTAGIALFSSPSNYQHPCRWHVRTYGLFAANPFGVHHFPEGDPVQGAKTIPEGESLTLSYRVVLHPGTTEEADIAGLYNEYTAE